MADTSNPYFTPDRDYSREQFERDYRDTSAPKPSIFIIDELPELVNKIKDLIYKKTQVTKNGEK